MSWFESSSFSSLAKTALNSAQKSIDRVLDIQDDDGQQDLGPAAKLAQTGKKPSAGGWSSWISPTAKQKASSISSPPSSAQKRASPVRSVETDEFFADFLGGSPQSNKPPSPSVQQPVQAGTTPKQSPTPSQTKPLPQQGGINTFPPSGDKHKQRRKQPGQFKLQPASPTTSTPQAKDSVHNDTVVTISLTEERSVTSLIDTSDTMSSSSHSDFSASSERHTGSESGPEKEGMSDSTVSTDTGIVPDKVDIQGAFKLDHVEVNHVGSTVETRGLVLDGEELSYNSTIDGEVKEDSNVGHTADIVISTANVLTTDDSSFTSNSMETVLETKLEETRQSIQEDKDEVQMQPATSEQLGEREKQFVEDLEQSIDGLTHETPIQQTSEMEESEEISLTDGLSEDTKHEDVAHNETHVSNQEPLTMEEEPPSLREEESSVGEDMSAVVLSSTEKEMTNSTGLIDDSTVAAQVYREQDSEIVEQQHETVEQQHETVEQQHETVEQQHDRHAVSLDRKEKVSQQEHGVLESTSGEGKEEDRVPDAPCEEPGSRETEPTDETETDGAHHDVEAMTGPVDGTNQDSVQAQTSEEDSAPQNNALDPQKLLKKLADMAEVLQARETRLLELSKQNMDLEETNNILRGQLQQAEDAHQAEMTDINSLTEEFTERIATTEKKLQAVMKDKETLNRQLKAKEEELCQRVNDKQMAQLLQEKDEQIEALMEEGQKLSKQQLQSSNIIKKLRAKEKESDSVIKSQKERLDKLQENVDHLTHVLDAKEDIDKQQKDAIKKLNSALEKQTKELTIAKSELEEAQDRVRSMQSALDSSYKEIGELHKVNAARDSKIQDMTLSAQLQAKEELRLALEQEQDKARSGQEKLLQQVEDLRLSLQRAENQQSRQEDLLRQEISDMQQRLQEADARNQELSQSVTAATRPLLRQIENLQSNFSAQTSSWERVEKNLTERLAEAQSQLAEASERERMATETMMEVKARVTSLESKCALLRQEKSRLLTEIEMERAKVINMEDARHREQAQLEALQQTSDKQKEEWTKQKLLLENQLEMERLKVDTEKKKTALAQEQAQRDRELLQKERDRQWSKMDHGSRSHSRSSSVSDTSQNSSFFQPIQGDSSETAYSPLSPMTNSTSGTLLDSMRSASTSTLFEGLQSTLKMRDGEITQLQDEIVTLERQRAAMAEELVSLSAHNQDLLQQLEQMPTLREKVKNLEQRYNAMLQMYGEKAEEADELKMDLEDIKAMYKQQISDLLSKMT